MMSSLYVGLSALANSSNALNTTANNLANVNTKGYVRQQVVFEDLPYNTTQQFATTALRKGLGVAIQDVEHVRSILLDEAYRRENGRESFYEKLVDATDEIQSQLGELNKISYQNTINDMHSAFNEVAKTPDDNVARAALVQSAIVFLDKSQSIYKGLLQYQDNLNSNIEGMINRINEIGYQIMDLNNKISVTESGRDTAMTLRDERDNLLDELSGYVKIQTQEDAKGDVCVMIENVFFCNRVGVSEIGLQVMRDTGFVNPVWKDMGDEPVYNMSVSMATDANTDIGALKGLLAARGSLKPTYANTLNVEKPAKLWPEGPKEYDYVKDGVFDKASYEADLNIFKEYSDHRYYMECEDYSIVARSIANFDKLVNSIVDQINEVLSPTKTVKDDNGVEYKVLDMDKTGYGQDINNTIGTELFSRKYTDRYKQKQLTVNGVTENYYVYNEENSFGHKSYYSIANIEINSDILQDYAFLPLNGKDGKVDYSKAQQLVEIFSNDILQFRDGMEKLSFEEFYEALINDVAGEGRIYDSMVNNQSSVVANVDDARQQIMGVSSDEELTSLIKYQQSYNAASRYINVITMMMDTIINMMLS